MRNTLAWQHMNRRIGARWSRELRIEKSHLQRSSLSADLRPQRSASTSERGWLPQPRSHAVARTPYSSPHFGPSRRSDLSQNGYAPFLSFFFFFFFFFFEGRIRNPRGLEDLRNPNSSRSERHKKLHCVPWYCLAILSLCLAYKKKSELRSGSS